MNTETTDDIIRKHYERIAAFETEHKGTWAECRVADGPHKGDLDEFGWCEGHKYPSDRCNVVHNGTAFICRYHNRYWEKGICPGLQGPFG